MQGKHRTTHRDSAAVVCGGCASRCSAVRESSCRAPASFNDVVLARWRIGDA
jgi:hypothetical protein